MKAHLLTATLIFSTFIALPASATTISLLDGSQDWTHTDTRPGGSAQIVDLTGVGGALESGAPTGSGVLKLTTDSSNEAKAEVGIMGDFGRVADILTAGFNIGYSWFDSAPSAVAAPSIKLAFYNSSYGGDGYGQLIFEPYAQGPNDSTYITPAQDIWTTQTIDLTNGRAWNTGMFNIGSSFAGPPNRTLGEWMGLFDPGFSEARLIGISIGIGSYNPSETGYVDNVRINGTLLDGQFDFEALAVPAPATMAILLPGLLAMLLMLRRRYFLG